MGGKARPLALVPGVWPVEGFGEYEPKVSDGFQRPGPKAKRGGKGHLGIDVMFRRREKGPEARPARTKWYFCPSHVIRAVVVHKGTIGRVKFSARQGWWVEVKHGRYMTVYRHLANVSVKPGDEVEAGDLVGIVSHAPHAGKRGINHLHFEVWDMLRPGPRRRAYKVVDPKPWLRRWKKL